MKKPPIFTRWRKDSARLLARMKKPPIFTRRRKDSARLLARMKKPPIFTIKKPPIFTSHLTLPTSRVAKFVNPKIFRIPPGAAGLVIKNEINSRIQHHAAVLQTMKITDVSSLGKLSIFGDCIPEMGVLKATSVTYDSNARLGSKAVFRNVFRIKPGVRTADGIMEKMGGTAYFLKAEKFPRQITPRVPPRPYLKRKFMKLFKPLPIQPHFLTTTVHEVKEAYWTASWIDIADNTNIIIKQPIHWLVMIAPKITIGKNVNITWERSVKSTPSPLDKLPKQASPPTSRWMRGTNGAGGENGKPGDYNGDKGEDGPEIEMWTLEINRLPSVLIWGQDGFKGRDGQDGQDGQNGARGRKWIKGFAGSCKSGPGNGGRGGKGGDGGIGARGGDGGNGGTFALYASESALSTVGELGFHLDTAPGRKSDESKGGLGGKGGSGGRPGTDRRIKCRTDFGKHGKNGLDGLDRSKQFGEPGHDGDYCEYSEKLVPIDDATFYQAFTKPKIGALTQEAAKEGDVVSATGERFTSTDIVMVDNVDANTTVSNDTVLSFTVPRVQGGENKPVQVRQQDGTLSNRATLNIVPKLFFVEQGGKKSTDRPPARFTPGTMVTLVGTGFASDARVRIEDQYVSDGDVQYIDSTRLTFKLIRPLVTLQNPEGESVDVKVLTDGLESNSITIILDTYVMVVLGDSLQWGQGLRRDLKFHTLVENNIRATRGEMGVYKMVLAHSGAIIGVGDNTQLGPVDGEVPTPYPTILQQVDAYSGDRAIVDLVLLNGGINDIGLEEILNPIATSDLASLAQQHCYDDMIILLEKVTQEFPHAKIIVTGYYQMVSDDSDLSKLIILLMGHGMLAGPLAGVIVGMVSAAQKDKMVDRCHTFAVETNQKFKDAVQYINDTLPDGSRVYFVKPDFGSKNAIFAPNTWTWGLDADMSPVDIEQHGGVASSRIQACDVVGSSRTNMILCPIASMGHPNPDGASEYARVINLLL